MGNGCADLLALIVMDPTGFKFIRDAFSHAILLRNIDLYKKADENQKMALLLRN